MTTERAADTIGARLAAVAQRHADKVAVIERDAQRTYGQLDADANAIAARLAPGVEGNRGVVGLLFQRRLPAIQAIFGAARSGHAYVPLDAGDPEDRLRHILADAAPVALLTEAALVDRAAALAPAGCAVVDVEQLPRGVDASALAAVTADAPAFLYFTSGSTGRPKGVVQTHRNVLFFVDAYARALALTAGDRMSLLYALSVAAGNNTVLRALLHGATLCAFDLRRHGIPQLADWLDRERITVLHAVPTVFREMAGRLAAERLLPHLRAIHLGGEAVFGGDVALYRQHTLGHCVLVNQLASTEAGIVAQNVITHRGAPPPGGIVSVGRPVDRVRVEIRRDDGELADAGEVGEVVVCSAHLSPGYWRRPDLDAAAFSADPREPGWRRFRSGDLGHVDAAGELNFLGRAGSRVKIRGHTVDLMEIEAALAACAGVARAAVAADGDVSRGDATRVIAYVEMRAEAARDASALRRDLASRLPLYMLPAAIVYAAPLPSTVSGKVDRAALAALRSADADGERAIVAPQDDVEQTVADIFAALLGVAQVGRDDDFFLLGGDSLMGVELQSRLRERFRVHVANFHADATVRRIAANVRAEIDHPAARAQPLPVMIPLWRNGREPPLFLVHGRHGQAFVSPHFMQLLGDQQPVWAFQARGLDGLRDPHATIEAMAAEYLDAMRAAQPRGPYFLGSLCAGAYVAAVMARALRAAGEALLPLLLLDPPNSVAQRGYSQLTEERFVEKMRARKALGRTAGPVDDPAYVEALIATAMAFEQAIAAHRPLPYDGPVYVLSSRQRMQDSSGLRQIFTGRFKRYEVGTTHSNALDPRNPAFAGALTRCVGLIREAARDVR